MDFAVPADYNMKINESGKIDKYLNLPDDLKKISVEHVGDGDTNRNCSYWNIPQSLQKETGESENQSMN